MQPLNSGINREEASATFIETDVSEKVAGRKIEKEKREEEGRLLNRRRRNRFKGVSVPARFSSRPKIIRLAERRRSSSLFSSTVRRNQRMATVERNQRKRLGPRVNASNW